MYGGFSMETTLMDIKQVAAYLKMNKMTIYKLARDGKIPAFKVTSEWRFKRDLIDAWLSKRLTGSDYLPEQPVAIIHPGEKTALIVDDEAPIREFFTRMLTGYQVLTAGSGEEALEIIKKNRPDLVLLDIKMPGIDGIETLKRIKEFDKRIVVIMMSAHSTLENNFEAARLGAFTSIAKPFDVKDMQSIINSALNETASSPTLSEK